MKIIWILLFSLNGSTVEMAFDSYQYCTTVQQRLADQYREAKVTCEEVILKQT